MTDDDIKNQRAIIARATAPGPFVKGRRYNLVNGAILYVDDGGLVDVLTEEHGAPLYEAVPIADAEFVIAASVLWPAALDEIEQLRRRAAEHAFEASVGALPIPMILTCPVCGERHVDEGEFATRSHETHACQSCGLVWKPARVPTVGVRFLPGYKDEYPPADPSAMLVDARADATNDRNRCAEPGCEASHSIDIDDLAESQGWLFRRGFGWRCPTHAAAYGTKLIGARTLAGKRGR